jgi:hypothetical protein
MGTSSTAALPANWKMSAAGGGSTATWLAAGNFTAVNLQASSGSPSTGGRYNWGTTTTERAAGFMTSGSYASPNAIMAHYKNTSGQIITQIVIGYQVERYRVNSATCALDFSSSTDGISWTARPTGDIASNVFPVGTSAYTFITPQTETRSVTLSGLNMHPNAEIYLRWNFNTTGSNSQGLGLDEVSVTATLTPVTPLINVSLSTLPDFGNIIVGNTSSVQNYNVSGSFLTDDILVSAPSDFEVSLSASSGFGPTVTLVQISGNVTITPLYVRFVPGSAGPFLDQISHSSTGATSMNVQVSGTGIAGLAPEPSIQASNISFGGVGQNSMNVFWTNGDGSSRIVLARAAGAVNSDPVDASSYSANSAFGSGSQIGSGNFVVYAGSGNNTLVTNLAGGTEYHFSVYEFNGAGGQENYLTSLSVVGNQSTLVATYVWSSPVIASYSLASNWSPPRMAPSQSDVLVFNTGGSRQMNGLLNQTIGKFEVTNNTQLILTSSSPCVLTITGGNNAFILDAGSHLQVEGANGISFSLSTGSKGNVAGNMMFMGGAHRLMAVDSGAILIQTGSVFTTGTGFSGNAFGNNILYPYSVIFDNGSTYLHRAGSNPFAITQPLSMVNFRPNSLFKHESSGSPSLSGRSYGNFELNEGTANITGTGTGVLTFNNLIVTSGTLNLNLTGGIHIHGNISSAGGSSLSFNPSAPAEIFLNGTSTQTIGGSGNMFFQSNTALYIMNPFNIVLSRNLNVDGYMELSIGKVITGSNKLVLGTAGSLAGAGNSSGYILGRLEKQITTGMTSRFFETGDSMGYAPISLGFSNVTSGGALIVSSKTGDHPSIGSSTIDPLKSVNRYWNIIPNVAPAMTAYSATFSFSPSDFDPGANTNSFNADLHNGSNWSSLIIGTRTSVSTQITGLTLFGDFQIGESASIVPFVTTQPSLQQICDNQQVSFTSFASGTPTPAIQWEESTDNGASFSPIAGANANTLTFTVSAALNNYQYRAVFTNTGGSAVSSAVVLTVYNLPANPFVTASGSTSFCPGGSVLLSSSVANQYLWSPGGETSQSIIANTSGNYSVEITDGNGCKSSSVNTVVTVFPAMPTPFISTSGPLTFCLGDSVSLTSSTAFSYQWSPGNETTQVIVVKSAGSYTATVTDENGCSAASVATIVNVNDIPVANITANGPLIFCDGESVTLTGHGGLSYLWMPGSFSGQNLTVYSSGSVTVIATDANGCSAESGPVNVNVLPNPAAVITQSGPLSFCEGDSVTLSASGGANYLWSPGGQTTQSITVKLQGSQSVIVTAGNGCVDSTFVIITVFSKPIATIQASGLLSFCQGDSVGLSSSQAATYLWNPGGLTTSGITVSSSGNYSLVITDINNCTSDPDSVSVEVFPLPSGIMTGDTTVNQGNSANLNVVLTGTPPWNVSYFDGTSVINVSNVSVSPLTIPVSPQSGTTYTLTGVTDLECNGTVSGSAVVTVIPAGFTVSGSVNYDNSSSTPMNSTNVYLMSGLDTIATTITDNFGYYFFHGILPGNYLIHCTTSKPWGGVNGTDALQIRRHTAFVALLTGVRLVGSDVNLSGSVNSTDALLVQRRFSFIINSFTSGDWYFEKPSFTISNNSVSHSIKALCFGDANGSYVP